MPAYGYVSLSVCLFVGPHSIVVFTYRREISVFDTVQFEGWRCNLIHCSKGEIREQGKGIKRRKNDVKDEDMKEMVPCCILMGFYTTVHPFSYEA
jgi:hypothetical protein